MRLMKGTVGQTSAFDPALPCWPIQPRGPVVGVDLPHVNLLSDAAPDLTGKEDS